MKYLITFHYILQDDTYRNETLVFGETDVKSIAEKCFEAGKQSHWTHVTIKKVYKENDKMLKYLQQDS